MTRLALVFLLGALVACRTTDPAEADPSPQKSPPTATTAPSSAAAVKAKGVQLIAAPAGDVATVVKTQRDEARARGRKLLVYIGATWCEPCQRFHHAAEAGELDAQFPNLSLLVFDADRDGDRLRAAGYAPGYIPYFGVPGDDGRATSNGTEGSVKGEGAVDHITPRLAKLVADAR